MEAATKILDPRDQPSTRPSSVPLRIRNSKENMVVSQSHRTSRILESARTPVDSNELRYLGGQSFNRNWNGHKDNAVFRRSQDSRDACPADVKGKGKSISLAIQAKVNIQRREGLSSSPRNSVVQKVHDECSCSQHFRSPPTNQNNKHMKQPSAINTSGVLRPNKQKQNCMSGKGKLSSKQSMSNEMNGRKVLGRHSSSTKNMTSNKISGNFRFVHNEKEGSLSGDKDFPRKKRLMERSFVSDKIGFIDDALLDRHEKRIQPNVVVDEHSCSRQKEDYRSDGADVVSYTFMSPLRKPTSRFFTQVAENLDNVNMHCFGNYNQKKDNDANDKKLHSHGLNVINGDAFNLFLEQKLRELTSGADPSCGSILNFGSSVASSSILQDPAFDLDTIDNATVEHEEQAPRRDKPDTVFGYGISSTNGQMHGSISFQEVLKYNGGNDARRELDNQHEARHVHLTIQAQCNASFNSASKTLSTEAKMELSDSASATLTETSDEPEFSNANHTKASNCDLDNVREILSDATLVSKDMLVNPLLFDKLEDKRRVKDKDGRLKRKVLFDCVNECLDSKCSRYFRSGYRAWSKGIELVCGKQSLAHEVYDEILRWMGMGDWMVDELVDNDMSSHLGKWLDHEIEAFEEGLGVQSEIVDSLVDEVIADCLMKAPCL